jgi:hypothetical protein
MDDLEWLQPSDSSSDDDLDRLDESSEDEASASRRKHPKLGWEKEAFVYPSLNLDGPAFRLLRLHKGAGPRISCDLFKTWLNGPERHISYEALSYHWGKNDVSRRIEVNGAHHEITLNLHAALCHLRLPDQDRVLWVDAICIDQGNEALAERSHQVRHMTQIYKQADGVIFWLDEWNSEWNSESKPAVDAVFRCLALLREEGEERGCDPSKYDDPRWMAIWTGHCASLVDPQLVSYGMRTLLGRPWFRRVWILQEVANARAALVCCGNRSSQARYFALASRLVGIKVDRHCQAVLEMMPGSGRETSWWGQERSLYTLLKKFGAGCEASDPRDKIYALLGLSTDAKDSEILTPDYEKKVDEVIHDAFHFLYFCKPTPDMVWTVKTMEEFILQIRSLNSVALKGLVSAAAAPGLRQLLDRDDVKISDGIITAVLENESSAEDVMAVLIRQRGSEMRATTAALTLGAVHNAIPESGLRALGMLLRHNIVDTDMLLDSLTPSEIPFPENISDNDSVFGVVNNTRLRYQAAPASSTPITIAAALTLSLLLLHDQERFSRTTVRLSPLQDGHVREHVGQHGVIAPFSASREQYKNFLRLPSYLLEFEENINQESGPPPLGPVGAWCRMRRTWALYRRIH